MSAIRQMADQICRMKRPERKKKGPVRESTKNKVLSVLDAEWKSVAEAHRLTGMDSSTIRRTCDLLVDDRIAEVRTVVLPGGAKQRQYKLRTADM